MSSPFASSPATEPNSPRISASAFIGVMWAGVSITLLFVIFRILVRLISFHKVFSDDYLVTGAWLMFLASSIFWQVSYKPVFEQYSLRSADAEDNPQFLMSLTRSLKFQVAEQILFYTSLWTVKLSFLIFFRRLGLKVRGFKIWWWIVTGLTIATWVTTFGVIQYKCEVGNIAEIFGKCGEQGSISFDWKTIHYNTATDVITDALIITIPVLLLWNVQISMRKKLALLGIFSLTLITIVFSIIRVAVVTTSHIQPNIPWVFLWGNIEVSISLIVACLGSFRQLFTKRSATPRRTRFNTPHISQSENLTLRQRLLYAILNGPSEKTSNSNSSGSQKKSRDGPSYPLHNASSFEHIMSNAPPPVHLARDEESATKSFDTMV
jgi:hypothetical protein